MHSIAIAVPIRPGRTEAWRQYASDLMGTWKEERDEDYRRFGILRAAAWLQRNSNEDMAILYWDVEDPELHRQQFHQIMTSDDEYCTFVRENLTDIFGFEPDQPRPPLPELVADYRLPGAEPSTSLTSIALATPIKPGKGDTWKQRTQEMHRIQGSDIEADWRRFGIRRSASWLQRTPGGDLAILYWEANDPEQLAKRSETIMSSDDGYYTALRASLADIFEIQPGQSRPSSELVTDFRPVQSGKL